MFAALPACAALLSPLSWAELAQRLPSAEAARPVHIDSVLYRGTPSFSDVAPTLFRERHGWCPYSERVWLALELKAVGYETVTIDNTGGGRPSYFSGSTPQIRWPNGKTQGESNDLVKALDIVFPDSPPLWPPEGVPMSDVSAMVSEWKRTMPSARPSSRAAFLFDYDGDALPRSTFEHSLDKTEELLGKHPGGPFFCGEAVSAADVAWAPFLESLVHTEGMHHEAEWGHVYVCRAATASSLPYRVRGDAASWRKVLSMAGYGNSGVPPRVLARMDEAAAAEVFGASDVSLATWQEYASVRPHVAATPAAEAAATILRNCKAILADAAKRDALEDEAELDGALRIIATLLLDEDELTDAVPDLAMRDSVSALAKFLDSRLCVPRDMGAPAAAALKRLAAELNA